MKTETKTKTKGEAPFHSAAWRESVTTDEFNESIILRYKWLNCLRSRWAWRVPYGPESKSINVIIFDDASDALAYVLTFP